MQLTTREAFQVLIGCDVQSVDDVRAAIDASGDRYLHRLLGDDERVEAARLRTPELVVRYVSGRFAAKEAVYKALRVSPGTALPWPQIEILSDDGGAPRVTLRGTAAGLAAAQGVDDIALSISHAGSFAFAVATALSTDPTREAVGHTLTYAPDHTESRLT